MKPDADLRSSFAWAPNAITMARVALAPVILAVLIVGALSHGAADPQDLDASVLRTAPAAGLLTAAALFDWLDGALARALKAESAFGRFWDPVADKLVIGAALVGGAAAMPSPLFIIPAALLILRDAGVTWLRTRPAHAAVTARPSTLAKWKTTLEYAALAILFSAALIARGAEQLLGNGVETSIRAQLALVGLAALWLAAALSLWTGWDYLRIARRDRL